MPDTAVATEDFRKAARNYAAGTVSRDIIREMYAAMDRTQLIAAQKFYEWTLWPGSYNSGGRIATEIWHLESLIANALRPTA